MGIRITVSDHVAFKVDGHITQDDGSAAAFQFTLHARRLLAGALKAQLDDEALLVPDFVASVATGWKGVLDDDGKEIPFSPDALRRLLDIPGVAGLVFKRYLEEIGARAKN